jgi:hypothetical protein
MLADFGLAKVRQTGETEEPNSFCGTPEYLGKRFTCSIAS